MQSTRSPRKTLALLLGLAGTLPLAAQIPYTSGTYTQDFDTLPSAPTTTAVTITGVFTGSANVAGTIAGIPAPTTASPLLGWSGARAGGSGTSANFVSDNGSSTSGALFSYGTAGSTDRALGALASGSNVMAFGAEFVNNTGGTITSITVSFTAEFWRSSTSLKNTLSFAYGVGGGTITSSNYLGSTAMTAATSLNVVGPDPVTTNGALDGNANKSTVSATITGLSIPNGTSFFIRWTDVNEAGNDAGLAVDDFNLSATVSTGSNISIGSANSLFTPTSFGGNAFTAQDTAVFNGAGGTVSLQGNVQATALSFEANGYTLANSTAGDSIALSGAIGVATGQTATISGTVAGTSGLSKIGAGTLVLSGANTFTGAVAINAGTLSVSADSAFGAAANDITVNGTLVSSVASLSLDAGRTLSGSGTISTPAGGTLSLAGPLSASSLSFNGLTTLNLGGASNSIANLIFDGAVTINVATGALQFTQGSTTGMALAQTSGTTTINGAVTFASGDKLFPVPGGTLAFNGALTYGGGRLVKTGAGTLDLTAAATSGTGGLRIGVIGSNPATAGEGGLVKIDSASDISTVQMHFNSGTLQATAPIDSTAGVSIGGRAATDRSSVLSIPTFTGSDMTFGGATGFFYNTSAPASDSDLAFNVNNVTRLNGTFSRTGTSTVWVVPGGTGTLVIGGDARALIDDILVIDTLTLVVDGQLGGKTLTIDNNAKLSGSGTFTGLVTTTTSADTPPVVTVTYSADSLATIEGTLAPSGLLTFNSGLNLAGATALDIGGLVRGSDYDSVAVANLATSGSITYTLTYGGTLALNFTAPAKNGTYDLFTISSNVSRAGTFSSVAVTGSHSASLTAAGTIWSGTVGGVTFSFDESTGVLTVTGGAAEHTALETWRFQKFGVYTDTAEVLAGDTEDFDGDGIANLLEYATGGDPTVAGASLVTQGKSGDFLTLSFPVISDSSLTYTVQASSDLGTGFSAVTGGSFNTSGGVRTYTDNVSLATAGVRRFLRLQVTVSNN